MKGKITITETEVLTKSGKRIPVSINASSIEINGKNYGIAIFRDITEEKRAQEIIKKEVERMRETDEAKTNFLNIVSHEMKTPLTAINAHLGVLDDLKGNLNEQELLSLEAIKRNNYFLKILIDNILELSRIESGKFELNMSKINLARVIKEVKSNLEILSEKKGLQLILDVGKLPEILADEMRIREILNNLISNSIKFTDKGWIKVKAERRDNHVVIKIIDSGVGIQKDKIDNLFQKFYQINSSIGRRFGGTGLGLAITKQLIELQGGKIKVESTYGKGSTFSVLLPINNHALKGGAK
jgi:signal transduction histidine kinase